MKCLGSNVLQSNISGEKGSHKMGQECANHKTKGGNACADNYSVFQRFKHSAVVFGSEIIADYGLGSLV